MKHTTFKNENNVEIPASIVNIDELFHAWEILKPSDVFYTWLERLISANIITKLELPEPKYLVVNIIDCIAN